MNVIPQVSGEEAWLYCLTALEVISQNTVWSEESEPTYLEKEQSESNVRFSKLKLRSTGQDLRVK